MCFSAKSSFIAAGTLSVIGLLSTHKATHNKKLLPLGATPLLFGIQQALEGIVWMNLNNKSNSEIYIFGTFGFVFFAGVWWPLWVPYMLYQLETNSTRKKLLFITLLVGSATSALYFVSLVTQPMQVLVTDHHLHYPILSAPFGSTNTITHYIENTMIEMYFIATLFPFFLSSVRYVWAIGIVMTVAAIVSQIKYPAATASVWCFFAAVASIFIYGVVRSYKKPL